MTDQEYSKIPSTLFSKVLYAEEEQKEEQELSAFTFAVIKLLGQDQARLSERIWLDEFDLMDSPPLPADRNVRAVATAASFRLAEEEILLDMNSNPR